jgi:5-methylcytosine-specific restriction protein A
MPARPLQLCRQHGCRTLTRNRAGRCDEHQREQTREGNKAGDPDRREAVRFYGSVRWKKLRLWVLQMHPLCVACKSEGTLRPATVVDHIKPRSERPDLAYDQDNLQPLCKTCHEAKSMIDDKNS